MLKFEVRLLGLIELVVLSGHVPLEAAADLGSPRTRRTLELGLLVALPTLVEVQVMSVLVVPSTSQACELLFQLC